MDCPSCREKMEKGIVRKRSVSYHTMKCNGFRGCGFSMFYTPSARPGHIKTVEREESK